MLLQHAEAHGPRRQHQSDIDTILAETSSPTRHTTGSRSTSHLPQSRWNAHLGITGTSRPPIHSKGSHQTSCITIGMGLVTSEAYTSVHQGNTSLQVPHHTSTTSRHSVALQQLIPLHVNTYCDSDWATDIESRKSTSSTVTSVLGVPLAFNSRTQSTVATSSA